MLGEEYLGRAWGNLLGCWQNSLRWSRKLFYGHILKICARIVYILYIILLLLSHFSRVRLCVTPQTAAHQAPPSLGFSRQDNWSGLPFPSPLYIIKMFKKNTKLSEPCFGRDMEQWDVWNTDVKYKHGTHFGKYLGTIGKVEDTWSSIPRTPLVGKLMHGNLCKRMFMAAQSIKLKN